MAESESNKPSRRPTLVIGILGRTPWWAIVIAPALIAAAGYACRQRRYSVLHN